MGLPCRRRVCDNHCSRTNATEGCGAPRQFSVLLAPVSTCQHASAPVSACLHLSARFRACQPLLSTRRSFLDSYACQPRAATLVWNLSAPVSTCQHLSAHVRACPTIPVPYCPVAMHIVPGCSRGASAIVPMRSQPSMPAENVDTTQHGHFSDWHGAHTTTHDGPPATRARS